MINTDLIIKDYNWETKSLTERALMKRCEPSGLTVYYDEAKYIDRYLYDNYKVQVKEILDTVRKTNTVRGYIILPVKLATRFIFSEQSDRVKYISLRQFKKDKDITPNFQTFGIIDYVRKKEVNIYLLIADSDLEDKIVVTNSINDETSKVLSIDLIERQVEHF